MTKEDIKHRIKQVLERHLALEDEIQEDRVILQRFLLEEGVRRDIQHFVNFDVSTYGSKTTVAELIQEAERTWDALPLWRRTELANE